MMRVLPAAILRILPLLALLAVLLTPVAGWAQLPYEQPDLPAWYEQPTDTFPDARSAVMDYVDVALLVAALGFATFAILYLRNRAAVWVTMIGALIYFGFVRQGCICPVGAVQNVLAGVFVPGYAVPWLVVAFFLLPLAVALLFGRSFCAGVCPLGAMQDVVAVKPQKVPAWLEHTLGMLPWVFLAAVILFAVTGTAHLICRYDPFVAAFRFSGGLSIWILLASVLLLGVVVARPYCRYACPYGALLRVASSLSWKHARITPDECVNCRLCEDACPYGAIHKPTRYAEKRREGMGRLVGALVLVPTLVVGVGWLGHVVSDALADVNPTIQLAEHVQNAWRLAGEEDIRFEQAAQRIEQGMNDPDEYFRHARQAHFDELAREKDLGQEAASRQLLREAGVLEDFFSRVGLWVGAGLGLILGLKLVSLSVRRTRTEYTIDRGKCLSCARCFETCPIEQQRLREKRTGSRRHEAAPHSDANPASDERTQKSMEVPK